MNNEEKEKNINNELEQKYSSSEDSSEQQNIILDFDEHPDTVREGDHAAILYGTGEKDPGIRHL